MKLFITVVLTFISTAALATTLDYTCHPSKNNPDDRKYALKVSEEGILLGFRDDNLKSAQEKPNKNTNWLKPFVQYAGKISELRGEGYLIAYLNPSLLSGGDSLRGGSKGGQMVLSWGYHFSKETSYLCIAK